ncbi:MAG: PEGA domain-containing protein [Candidatus Latescibacteria bacterium]|nr:PEGA domain-containing protein [Candidatus Latescibacterota bacterium]
MGAVVVKPIRIEGLVRNPDQEGALAHLDAERGFAFVARGAMTFADVIDPTIWVKEKLSLALLARSESGETPLRRAIATLRAVHGELMARPERERTWISTLVLLFTEGEGMALIAGDCPCYRFREGALSRLGRAPGHESPGPPPGSLGSETQVKLELVPVLAQSDDCYVLSTHPLREGELSVLARDLSAARDAGSFLNAAVQGSSDKGRVAIFVASAERSDERDARRIVPDAPAPSLSAYPRGEETTGSAGEPVDAPLEIEPIERSLEVEPVGRSLEAEPAERSFEAEPIGPSIDTPESPKAPAHLEPLPDTATRIPRLDVGLPRPGAHESFIERRPWYEWGAIWGGGALAIIAVALLIRAIVPGILGAPKAKIQEAAMPFGTGGRLDLYTDPPGASVRIDGAALETRTPATDVSIAPGIHTIEMDWGAYGGLRDTVEVTQGARLALHSRLLGSVSLRSSDPARLLDIYLDGAYAGSTPLVLDSVVVGKHLVRFGGPGLNTTAQEVEVLQGARVELVGSAGPAPDAGRVTIRSALLSDTGFEAGRGDPVWVDGEMRGVTPLTVEVKPGTHSVRVVRRQFPPQISVLDVKAGGEQFVTGEFGANSEEPLRFTPPASVSRSNPLPVTISLPEAEWDRSMAIWVYAAPPDGSYQPRRMTRIDEASKSFAALLPPEVVRNATRQVKVYFKAVGAAGRELYSEIFTIPVKD